MPCSRLPCPCHGLTCHVEIDRAVSTRVKTDPWQCQSVPCRVHVDLCPCRSMSTDACQCRSVSGPTIATRQPAILLIFMACLLQGGPDLSRPRLPCPCHGLTCHVEIDRAVSTRVKTDPCQCRSVPCRVHVDPCRSMSMLNANVECYR